MATRQERLAAVAAAHTAWVRAHVSDQATRDAFTPRGADSDYNLHHLDVDATPEQERAFVDAVEAAGGAPPRRGR